ncbi:MAG: hypothetical protein J1F02_08925 [Lachnospiraceae bacterium]|nr:hypothetical protein [Lachnospiraceae bacterium]
MKDFDKEIKKLSKEFQVPETYYEKVDEILENIQVDTVSTPRRKPFVKVAIIMAVFCVVITGCLFFSSADVAKASFLGTFKQTILDFLGMGEEEAQEMGISSDKREEVSKPDLLFELQEVIMDSQNIYAVVKITAPANLEFEKNMTFDYFGFCEGSNYNSSKLVSGPKECTLLEVMEGKKNVATYVVAISTDKQVKEGKEVTVFFKDLIEGPPRNIPQVLIEGMWNLTFTASKYDNEKNVTVKGTEEMNYTMLGREITIKKVKLLPLGLTVVSDMSNIPLDTLHVSDTRITVRLKMIDGSEKIVDSPDPDVKTLTSGSSVSEYQKGGKILHKYVCQFDKAIDINQVLGIYIEDCYIPIKEYE